MIFKNKEFWDKWAYEMSIMPLSEKKKKKLLVLYNTYFVTFILLPHLLSKIGSNSNIARKLERREVKEKLEKR